MFTSTRDGFLSKIYVMNSDGTNVRRLGNLPGQHSRPEFSLDNRKVLFRYSAEISSESQVYIMDSNGSNPRALTSPPDSHGAGQFTSDGRIVYSRALRSGPPFSALFIMDMDGSRNTPYVLEAPGIGKLGKLGSFSFGPRGMVVFTHHVMVQNLFLEQIFKMSVNGSGLTRLTNSPETYRLPGWCSNGGKIAYMNAGLTQAFTQPRHEHDGIYVMNADGTNAVRIADIDFSRTVGEPTSFGIGPGRITVQLSREPSFSRECKMLTFSLNLDGKDQVYVINTDGSSLNRLTDPPSANSEPVFSR
jgi:Tol biopolymer transport system component